MKNKNHTFYLKYLVFLLKDNAKKAKSEADNPKEGDADYNTRFLMPEVSCGGRNKPWIKTGLFFMIRYKGG